MKRSTTLLDEEFENEVTGNGEDGKDDGQKRGVGEPKGLRVETERRQN